MRGRRGPLLVVAGVLGLALLLVVVLVLPKMSEVSAARAELEEAEREQVTLESRLRALEEARDQAPTSREIIREIERQIPPTADLPGLILLLQNAAVGSGLDLVTLTPGTPAFDETTGLSTIDVAITAEGSYFDVAEFMFRIETLPRAARATSLSLSPAGESDTAGSPTLSFAGNVTLFTSDTSAGPGSIPGPTTEVPEEEG
ncbi:MAG: hypothetical protein KatS3mg013_0348 [Actinomycetota bacterium]|jgi:Tfp pilus assembly protein PilO|nr:MAG: hypothetical protein KatS3mg013_0348 [Actinomycetota bacterium]